MANTKSDLSTGLYFSWGITSKIESTDLRTYRHINLIYSSIKYFKRRKGVDIKYNGALPSSYQIFWGDHYHTCQNVTEF